MIFGESSIQAHSFLFIAGTITLIIFLVYIFVCEHKISADDSDLWEEAFMNVGFSPDQISHITHDNNVWYYKKRSTCVAYGDFSEKCDQNENYCAGCNMYGNENLQAQAVKKALANKGEHPECPLIYSGGT